MEKHIKRLSEEQRKLGVQVQVIYSGGDPSASEDLQVLRGVNLRNVRPQALRDFFFYAAVIALVLKHNLRADVLHIHGDWSAFIFGSIVKSCVKARVSVASVHGATRKNWGLIYKRVLKSYGLVMATGARDAAFLRESGVNGAIWRSSGIDSIYLDKDPVKGSFSSDVIIVGNFYPVKNLGFAINVAQAMPEVRFLFVGEGPELQASIARCAEQKILNVQFAGKLPPSAVAQSLRSSRVFLSTSYSEGTPTSILEAMASGLPVVTSNSNDFNELIQEGINGYVIQGYDVSDYCRKIRGLLLDEELRQEIASHNFVVGRKYGWKEVAKQITASICGSLSAATGKESR